MITLKHFVISTSIVWSLTTANALPVLLQDFELNTSGLTVTRAPAGAGYSAEAIDSEVLVHADETTESQIYLDADPSSNGGDYFLEVIMDFYDSTSESYLPYQGDRVTWNDGAQTGAFGSGFGHSVDVYFDAVSDGGGLIYNYENFGYTDGFYFQPTLLATNNSDVIDSGGFGVRLVDLGSGEYAWRVVADGNARGFSGAIGGSSYYDITVAAAGWYSMETVWRSADGLMVDQINTLYDESGSIVYTETIEDVVAVSAAGRVGAASLGNGDEGGVPSAVGSVAIDNLTLVPETSAYSLLAGLMVLTFSVAGRRSITHKRRS
ncbi:hypothetical protein QEH59_15090 [Coraliomargarita sp. SDUM461004]|uniref:PEP-CTERM sorting domain-containing protein n=1 Tax=Thalassobacterium sedimentorum TaxID=3041258 RepID=A0ABU1APS9_9BACT|nr:hypothetical protein [Coraliomargarita sp. SDUM461004]MDQ8195756.1 hypothetical protein [Coraliomargarita sp. SDUM461004]